MWRINVKRFICRRRVSSRITLCMLLLCLTTTIIYRNMHPNTGEAAIVEYDHITFRCKHRCDAVGDRADNHNDNAENNPRVSRGGHRKMKLILFYTKIFDRVPVLYPETYNCCQPFHCTFTVDRARIGESDAVVFHGRDMPRADKMPTEKRLARQRWIFYTLENPYNTRIMAKDYNGMFNWTMSYERKTDIPVPYGFYRQKMHSGTGYPQRDYASGKDKFIVFLNSHCRTLDRVRENLIRDITKYAKVDIYGECGGVFGRLMCPREGTRCFDLLRRYKFTLAFENFQCQDYITEKYWRVALHLEIVPIVYGGKHFKDLAIPGSYIDASKFADVEELSNYLQYLDRNNTAYNEYFKWKMFYEDADLEPWPCRLCSMLHNSSLPVKTYTRFDRFMDPDIECNKIRAKVFQKYSM